MLDTHVVARGEPHLFGVCFSRGKEVNPPLMWSWIRINAAALTVVGAFLGGLTGAVWYLGTTMATTTDVNQVETKVDAVSDQLLTLATTAAVEEVETKVDAVSDQLDQFQAMFPLMVVCILEQNRQLMVAIDLSGLPPTGNPDIDPRLRGPQDLPASCDTALALAQRAAGGQ